MTVKREALSDRYEWRVAYTLPERVGGIAAGTYHHTCHSRDHALNAYAHHMSRATVTRVAIERREFAEWQPVEITALASDENQDGGENHG